MILIVPDVHEQIKKLLRILQKYNYVSLVIFLGDFMDSYRGLSLETEPTIQWLKENLRKPNYRFCLGNHDMHYAYPYDELKCSGFDPRKNVLFNMTLNRELIGKMRLFHWAGDWFCSHAGIHERYLHPIHGYDRQALLEMEHDAISSLQFGRITNLFSIGRSRGGRAVVGGVNWLDFEKEFSPIEGLNQIVGHTRRETVRTKNTAGSTNYCIDTNLRHVGLVDDAGNFTTERVYAQHLFRVTKEGPKLYQIEYSDDDAATWMVVMSGLRRKELNPVIDDLILSSDDEFIDTPDFTL